MSDKSYVSMEQHQCLACGEFYDTGAILMDRRLKNTFERNTLTGHGLCPSHRKDGFVCLIAVDPSTAHGETIKPWEANHTGQVAYLRNEVWSDVMNKPVPPRGVCFCEPAVIAKLASMAEPDSPEAPQPDNSKPS